MYTEIELEKSDETTEVVAFEANAATQIRYKMIFNEELLKGISEYLSNMSEVNSDEVTETAVMEVLGSSSFGVISKLAYVMNKQAKKEIQKANVDDYIEWLTEFSSLAFITVANDIIGVYLHNRNGSSTPKKDTAPQIEK